jgi:hypothetical protein
VTASTGSRSCTIRAASWRCREISRKKPTLKNRLPIEVEEAAVALAIEQPAWDQVRIAEALKRRGLSICASVSRMPSCATLASNAFRRSFIEASSWVLPHAHARRRDRLVRDRLAPEVDADKTAHCSRIVERLLHRRVRPVESLLQEK